MDLTPTTLPTPPPDGAGEGSVAPDPAALLAELETALILEQRLNMNRPREIRLTRMRSLAASLRASLSLDGAPAA